MTHARAPPVGLVDVNTFKRPPTATHSDGDGHDTPDSPPKPADGTVAVVHAPAPPVGLVEVTTCWYAAPTQSQGDGHEMLAM